MTALARKVWDRLSIYLPIVLMGLFALGSWWLVRSTPDLIEAEAGRAVRHEPDYFMHGFAVKTFAADGRLKSEIRGVEARHFPDTDTLDIDQVRVHSLDPSGRVTVATALRGLSNHDGTEIQLLGDARVVRERATTPSGEVLPRLEFRGELLHIFQDSERVKSHLPVQLTRGTDQFTAETMDYDHQGRVLDLRGRVRGVLQPRGTR